MKDLKRIGELIRPTMQVCFALAIVLIVIVDGGSIYITYELSKSPNYVSKVICFQNKHLVILSLSLFVLSFIWSSNLFNIYISTMAERKRCLKGCISWTLLVSLGVVLMNRIACVSLATLTEQLLDLWTEAFGRIDILKEWSIYIGMQSLGWGLGAIWHRFKKLGMIIDTLLGIYILGALGNGSITRFLLEESNGVIKMLFISIVIGYMGSFILISSPIKRYTKGYENGRGGLDASRSTQSKYD